LPLSHAFDARRSVYVSVIIPESPPHFLHSSSILKRSLMARLKQLETENARLKLVAERDLEIEIMKESKPPVKSSPEAYGLPAVSDSAAGAGHKNSATIRMVS
jgi:hypothetical protein